MTRLSVVDFDGDEAVAEAMAGMKEAQSTRGGLLRGAGALAGPALAAALPARRGRRAQRRHRRRTTSRSSTSR